MKMDYCTVVVKEREKEFLSMQVNSLLHYCGNDYFNIRVCVPEGAKNIIKHCKSLPVEIVELPTFEQNYNINVLGRIDFGAFDLSNRLNHLMKTSNADWVVLTHADIAYKSSLRHSAEFVRKHTKTMGMMGVFQHGVTFVNCEVYNNCHFGFWPLPVAYVEDCGDYVRIHAEKDGLLVVESKPAIALDVSDLLKIEIASFGYKFDRTVVAHYGHAGFQSEHIVRKAGENEDQRRSAEKLIVQRRNEFFDVFGGF